MSLPAPTLPHGLGHVCLALVCFTAAATAQVVALPSTLAPSTTELPHRAGLPFLVPACRLQVLYDERELGGTTSLSVSRVSLRYDGPSGSTARAHRVAHLTARIGATQVDSAAAGSVFAANRSQALTTVGSGPLDYVTDGLAVGGPQAFGGADGRLVLPLAQPVALTVPRGGAFVFELDCEGNDNRNDAAWLDAFVDPANSRGPGFAAKNGRGCPVGALGTSPVLDISGTFEPGGALQVGGTGYPQNGAVAVVVTSSLFASPVAFPTTNPICWAYVDTGTVLSTLLAASGDDGGLRGGGALPVPKRPASAGAVIYLQAVTPIAPFTGNSLGLASSNYRTVQIGLAKTPSVGAWTAAHADDAQALVATTSFYGGLALALQ